MPASRVSERIIAEGYRCYVRAGKNASSAKVIGYVEVFKSTMTYTLQEARVIGELVAASIDPQSVSCSLNLSGFIPSKPVIESGVAISEINDVKISLLTLFPDAKKIRDKKIVTKIPYIDFKDQDNDCIMASFEGAVTETASISVNAASYVKGDVNMKVLDWEVIAHNLGLLK